MNLSGAKNHTDLVKLIDQLAPINNRFRNIKEPLAKIEAMWDFGEILNRYVQEKNIKLDRLLFQIYDPHSTVKMSYITRDLGSYSSRINKYFKERSEIRSMLKGLYSPSVFREAIPLLFNPRYNLTEKDKEEIVKKITTPQDIRRVTIELRDIKKRILPIKNPRNQKANEYEDEKKYLDALFQNLKTLYLQNPQKPSQIEIEKLLDKEENRIAFVIVLMALASESFLNKISDLNTKLLNENMKKIFAIVETDTRKRARFRKWVMDSNQLLKIAEAIHSLGNDDDYRQFRIKITK